MQPEDVDPEIVAARALQARAAAPFDVTKLEPAVGRALANKVAMVFSDEKPELARVETMFFEAPGGELRCRLYQPENAMGGAILYVHGGGWFACNVDTHDRMTRYLAQQSGSAVLSIDYRPSPENFFPAALEDALAGWQFLRARAETWGIDPTRLAVCGDSAGANLALALTLSERDAGRSMPAALGLLYGCFAPELKTPSRERYGNGLYGLTGPRMDWYWANYLGPHAVAPPVLATPYHADFAGLPPVYLGVAECDVLADENRMLAARMAVAGVAVTLDIWPGVTHGALQMTRDVQSARDAVAATAQALTRWIGKGAAAAAFV